MKFWQGFVFLWILFFIFLAFVSIYGSGNSITGYIPFTGVLKEEPGMQVLIPELNVSFELGEGDFNRIWDINYFISFEKENNFDAFVNLNYLLFDSENNLVYSDEERILVGESMILEGNLDTRKAHEIELEPGNYIFVLRVMIGEKEMSFSEKFEIKKLSDFLYSLKQLFDIKMELYTSSFYNLDEFGAKVIFESFGSEPTPVNLTFIIYDELDNQVYRKQSSVTVETEYVLFENFEDLDIKPGKYLLVLRTIYNVDVEDYFEQNFEYMKKQNYWYLIIIAVVVVLGLFFGFKNKVFGVEGKKKIIIRK
jgi:hypothetical protein